MELLACNPFLRVAMVQPFVMEGDELRFAYDYRLFLVLEGNGTFVMADGAHPIGKNTLLCFPHGVGYHFVGKMKVIVFNFDMTQYGAKRKEPRMPLPTRLFCKEEVFDETVADGFEHPMLFYADEEMKDRIWEITNTYLSSGEYRDVLCSAMLKQLLAQILLRKHEPKDAQTELTERILCYIRTNAAQIKDNGTLAEEFGYHPIYLSNVFKQKTGQTLHQAILEEKMRLAGQWLLLTNRSVEEIALEVGFSSRNHFLHRLQEAVRNVPT